MLCGKGRDRTQNLGLPSPALCQLRYETGREESDTAVFRIDLVGLIEVSRPLNQVTQCRMRSESQTWTLFLAADSA